MRSVNALVTEAIAEELGYGLDRTESHSDLSALLHAIGQTWRDLPPELKSYLLREAHSILRRLGRDPRGAMIQIARLAGLLLWRRGLTPQQAIGSAAAQVLHLPRASVVPKWHPQGGSKYTRGQQTPTHRLPPSRPMAKTRWQRGRRGNRFEAWS